jgi:hypothetical protein
MDRDVFLDRLRRATRRSRACAAGLVVDTLPDADVYRVVLNCSYDGNPLHPDEVVFPADVEKHGRRVGPLAAEEVVSLLWRDRRVPEWIDIVVSATDERATHFTLDCCGRFTSAEALLYYDWTDAAPFGVKGPAYPPRLIDRVIRGEPVEKFRLAESPQDPDD